MALGNLNSIQITRILNNWFNCKTKFDKQINVPFPWGSKLSQLNDEADIGWYKKIILPRIEIKKTYITVGALIGKYLA